MGNAESRQSADAAATAAAAAAAAAATRSSMPHRSSSTSARASSAPTLRSASESEGSSGSRTAVSNPPAARQGTATTDSVEAGGIERGQQVTEEAANQLSYWYLIKHGYNELVHLIIRPPRAQYDIEDLGPPAFTFGDLEYQRRDFSVVNDRQQTLQCSHWLPKQESVNGVTEFPCVIYLHGNSSCRVEALSVLRTCLASGMTVVAFDCAGCGKSEGDYISLGYYEREDLKAVIEHLRTNAKVTTVGLWGRSMGAATALLHADRDPTIAGIVVDSAFTNLEQLVQEIVERGRREGYTIPGFAVKIVMKFIRSSVQKRANFDIKRLSPIEHASISFVPALFIAAKGDEFIAPHHSDQIFAQYAGDKNIVKVKGDHNTVRPQFLLDSAGIFLHTALHVDARLSPDVPPARGGRSRTPWSSNSPSASWGLRMSDLDAAFSGRAASSSAMAAPKHEWACLQCTFVNQPRRMQCEICRALYVLSSDQVNRVPRGKSGRLIAKTNSSSSSNNASPKSDSRASDANSVDTKSVEVTLLTDPQPSNAPDSARTI